MNFSKPQLVLDTIRSCDEVERTRGENRVKINDLLNGAPPLSAEKAKKWGVQLNINWGEGPVLAANARRQYENAFLEGRNFFTVEIPDAPPEKASVWGLQITNWINKLLKDSEDYVWLHENKWASVIAQGLGVQVYYDAESWCPSFVAIEDFRVPTDTKTNLKELPWFAIRRSYTPGELVKKVFAKNADPGWNREEVTRVLDDMKDINYENSAYTWMTSPEKMAELVKQNMGYYSSDAVPTVTLWHFYYREDEDPRDDYWKMCIVGDPESGVHQVTTEEFVYENDCIARERAHLLHIQVGDLNIKTPFMIRSVRSLGFLLMEPCFWTNLMRCRYLQHVFEHFNLWLRVTDPAAKARAQAIQLYDKAVIPEGVAIVPSNERHQIDPNVVESAMAQLKQLMSEASQTYTQSTDTGTQREQTAFETRVKVESVNSMMSGLLGRASRKERFSYSEICRRLCLRETEDRDARRFQEYCKSKKIPKLFVNSELWNVIPDKPIGGGNPTMASSAGQELMAIRPAFGPAAQQEILHEVTAIITKDPRRAERWAPVGGKPEVTDAVRDAEFAFGTMMQGVPVRMKEGLSAAEQIETLIGLMSGVIARVVKSGNMATPTELAGLQTVGVYIGQLIQQLSTDPQNKARVKQYADSLGKLGNILKGFMQRAAEMAKQQQGNGVDPKAAAAIKGSMLKAQTDAKIKTAKAQQQLKHKEAAFALKQRHDQARAVGEQKLAAFRTGAEVQLNKMRSSNREED